MQSGTCAHESATRSAQHAARNTQRATRSAQHAARNTQRATRSAQHAARNTQRATRSAQHAARNTQRATRSAQHAARNTQRATRSAQHNITRYLFQLRVSLSPLRSHKFCHNFADTTSEICRCNQGIEDTKHFLFSCPDYATPRATLAASVLNILQKTT